MTLQDLFTVAILPLKWKFTLHMGTTLYFSQTFLNLLLIFHSENYSSKIVLILLFVSGGVTTLLFHIGSNYNRKLNKLVFMFAKRNFKQFDYLLVNII